MNERERKIRLWFDMWLQQKDLGIDEIFTEDVIYIESWSPKYENRSTVKHWFKEWNTRGKVLVLGAVEIIRGILYFTRIVPTEILAAGKTFVITGFLCIIVIAFFCYFGYSIFIHTPISYILWHYYRYSLIYVIFHM